MTKRILLIAALAGCCEEPASTEVHTWGDAAREVAMGQCSRWIECGTETQLDWRSCVNDLYWDLCNELLDRKIENGSGPTCADEYDRYFDEVVRCSQWYAQVTCGEYVEPCWL